MFFFGIHQREPVESVQRKQHKKNDEENMFLSFLNDFFFSLCKKLLHKLMFSLISIIKSLCLTSFLTEILQERVEWYILISSQFSNINCQNNFQLNFNTRTITSKERNSTPKISVKESKRNTEPPSIYQYLSLYGFLLLV